MAWNDNLRLWWWQLKTWFGFKPEEVCSQNIFEMALRGEKEKIRRISLTQIIDWNMVIRGAFRGENLFLAFFAENQAFIYNYPIHWTLLLDDAFEKGNVNIILWVMGKLKYSPLINMCKQGNVSSVQFILNKLDGGHYLYFPQLYNSACFGGNLTILQLIEEKRFSLFYANRQRNEIALDRRYDYFSWGTLKNAMEGAVEGGHVDIMKWVLEKGRNELVEFDWDKLIVEASGKNHFAAVQFIIECGATNFKDAFNAACQENHKRMALFLMHKYKLIPQHGMMWRYMHPSMIICLYYAGSSIIPINHTCLLLSRDDALNIADTLAYGIDHRVKRNAFLFKENLDRKEFRILLTEIVAVIKYRKLTLKYLLKPFLPTLLTKHIVAKFVASTDFVKIY